MQTLGAALKTRYQAIADLRLNERCRRNANSHCKKRMGRARIESMGERPTQSEPQSEWAIGPSRAVYLTREPEDRPHSPHAFKLMVPYESALVCEVQGVSYEVAPGQALLVAADVKRSSRSTGLRAGIFLDPEAEGRPLQAALGTASARLISGERGTKIAGLFPRGSVVADATGDDADLAQDLYKILDLDPKGRPIDARVTRALAILRECPPRPGLEGLCEELDLTPNRMRVLFKRDVGITPGRYLQWVRVAQALRRLSLGQLATEAAHASGFSDLAHFSRSAQRFLGMSPRPIRKAPSQLGEAPLRRDLKPSL